MYRFLISLLLLLPVTINAGTLKGVVTDYFNDKPIMGVSIYVIGTNQSARTDINGKFEIKNIKINVFDIKVSCIGYQPKLLSDIKLHSDSTKYMALGLETKPHDLSLTYRTYDMPEEACRFSLSNQNKIKLPILIKVYNEKIEKTSLESEYYIDRIMNDLLYSIHYRGVCPDYFIILQIFEDSTNLVLTLDNIIMQDNHNAVINLDEIFKSDKLKDNYIRLDSSLIHYESL